MIKYAIRFLSIGLVFASLFSCGEDKSKIFLPYGQITDIEENDSFYTANAVESNNSTVIGFYNEKPKGTDSDFFKFKFNEKAKAYRLSLTAVPGVDAKIVFYTTDKIRLFAMDECGVGEAEIVPKYYSKYSEIFISVESKYGSNKVVPYILSFTSEEVDKSVETEPNNTEDNANILIVNTPVKGYIVPGNDADYYKLTFDNDVIKDFRIKGESLSSLDLNIMILDKKTGNSKFINNSTWGGTELSQNFGSNKGDFYIRLTGNATDSMKDPLYFISIETPPATIDEKTVYYEREFNDSPESATILIQKEEMTGTIEKDDTDYYSFDIVNPGSSFNASITGISDRKFSLKIIDETGTTVHESDGTINIILNDLKNGRYYFSVTRNDPGSYMYKLFYTLN